MEDRSNQFNDPHSMVNNMGLWYRFTFMIWMCLKGFDFRTRFKMMWKITDFVRGLQVQELTAATVQASPVQDSPVQDPDPEEDVPSWEAEMDSMLKDVFDAPGAVQEEEEEEKEEEEEEKPEPESDQEVRDMMREALHQVLEEASAEADADMMQELFGPEVPYGPRNAANVLERKYGDLDDMKVRSRMRRTFWQMMNTPGQDADDNHKRRRIGDLYKSGDDAFKWEMVKSYHNAGDKSDWRSSVSEFEAFEPVP
jgi:hypothetical protein